MSPSYDRVLTRNEIDAHWVASGRASTLAPNVPPNALFTQSVADATVSLDASTSSDSDGTIALL